MDGVYEVRQLCLPTYEKGKTQKQHEDEAGIVEASSVNGFADLDLPDADELLLKSQMMDADGSG